MFKDFRLRKIAFLVLSGLLAVPNVQADPSTSEGSYAVNLRRLANVAFDSAAKTTDENDRLYEMLPPQEELRLAPGNPLADISVQSKSIDGPASSMYPHFKVKNIGDSNLQLGGLALHYWFNCDCAPHTTAFEGTVDWAGFMPSGLSITSRLQISFEPVSSGRQTHVMVVRFVNDSPALAPGQSVEIHTRFNRKDWGNMPPANDWSYAPFNTFTDWGRVAGYMNGSRVWGQEP